jgi:hypothetical protein
MTAACYCPMHKESAEAQCYSRMHKVSSEAQCYSPMLSPQRPLLGDPGAARVPAGSAGGLAYKHCSPLAVVREGQHPHYVLHSPSQLLNRPQAALKLLLHAATDSTGLFLRHGASLEHIMHACM